MKAEEAKRELLENLIVSCWETGNGDAHDCKTRFDNKRDRENCVSNNLDNAITDLNALLDEHYYPKEFTLWFRSEDFCNEFNECTDEDGLIYWEGTQSDLIITSTDELYRYWKSNNQ